MNELVAKVFANEMTEQGLIELQKTYPKNLKLKMTKDDVFKAAKKTKTEHNKLIDDIKRRGIDIADELMVHRKDLIEKVNGIYSVVLIPLEKEITARKVKAAKAAKELEELLTKERVEIVSIAGFLTSARGMTSKDIQGKIEAVDLIDVEVFHKDLIHEAIKVKKETTEALGQLLTDTISRENLDIERENLRIKEAEAETAKKLDEKILKLRMTPSEYFDKSSKEIEAKIKLLSDYVIVEKVFGDRCAEVETSKATVIAQLKQSLISAKMTEEAKDHDPVMSEMVAMGLVSEEEPTATVDDIPIEQTFNNSEWSAPEEKTDCSLLDDIAEWADRWKLEPLATEELDAILSIHNVDVD